MTQALGVAFVPESFDETNGIVRDENGVPDPDTLPYPLEVERYEEITIRVPIYKIPADAAKG